MAPEDGPINKLGMGSAIVKKQPGDPSTTAASVISADHGIPPEYANYADLFDKKAADVLPAHQEWDHHILLKKGKLPSYGPIYGLTLIKVEALQKKVDKNLGQGFIQPLTLPAGAPILFVKKKDGGLQLCVNYQGLNQITIKNCYALPFIGELIDGLRDAQYFTKIDLRGAYNLVWIAPGEEWKMAFQCRFGHFEYKVMPFELTNAPALFQALINDMLRPCLDHFACPYLDDIVIYSRTLKEHILNV